MPANFVQCYKEGFFFAFEHYEKFLGLCPDEYWKEKAGGWILAQQYYHGLMATNMLVGSLGFGSAQNPNPEAGQLLEKPDVTPTKEQAAEFLANIKIAAASACAKLDDEMLLKKNDVVSQKFGRDVTNAVVLELMANHLLYHLGCCDAELRDRNLPGSW